MSADAHTSSRMKIIIAVAVILLSSFFLFYHLGHYALWDDEADTALFGLSVWRTGDTYAMLDHNLIAHTNGQELKNLYNRYIPPLGFYLAAPFVGLAPGSALAARLPFALCGLLTIVLMLHWMWRARASLSTWLLMSAGILGNVSLMLYFRQCRYYAPAILCSTLLAYLYTYRQSRIHSSLAIAVTSLLLLASNFMFYSAVYACLAVDYLIWGRKDRPLNAKDCVWIFLPQVILGGLLLGTYNLVGGKLFGGPEVANWFQEKLAMVWWNLREINSCEHGVGILIALAAVLYFFKKDRNLIRGPVAIFTYCVVIALLAPLPMEGYTKATVRYLAPVIPVCIFTAVMAIEALTSSAKRFALPLAVLAFGTNVLHGGPLVGYDNQAMFSQPIAQSRFRSTVYEFAHELVHPMPSAYRAVSKWISANLNALDTVWVMPSFAAYPLMYHEPKVLYAWQLRPDFESYPALYSAPMETFQQGLSRKREERQFSRLPAIHFMESEALPDYVIAFGPQVFLVKLTFDRLKSRNISYEKIDQIDLYWYDLIRPELFWHSFRPIKRFSKDSQGIYIFRKM